MCYSFISMTSLVEQSDSQSTEYIRGVHVVLSLFADQLSGEFLNFFGRPNENCPVSETRHFFVHSFLKIGHSLISRLDKKKSREWAKKIVLTIGNRLIKISDKFHQKNSGFIDSGFMTTCD